MVLVCDTGGVLHTQSTQHETRFFYINIATSQSLSEHQACGSLARTSSSSRAHQQQAGRGCGLDFDRSLELGRREHQARGSLAGTSSSSRVHQQAGCGRGLYIGRREHQVRGCLARTSRSGAHQRQAGRGFRSG